MLALGAVSALYGILQAAVGTDLKRLLAYSTTENMGLVLVGVGAGGLFARRRRTCRWPALALAAALLHVVNHAAFKTLLFLAAGSVLRATGSRDLDALGGLRPGMPGTTALFGLGALAASALPPGTAFVSEWLLLQALVHGLPRRRRRHGGRDAAGGGRGRAYRRAGGGDVRQGVRASGSSPGPAASRRADGHGEPADHAGRDGRRPRVACVGLALAPGAWCCRRCPARPADAAIGTPPVVGRRLTCGWPGSPGPCRRC